MWPRFLTNQRTGSRGAHPHKIGGGGGEYDCGTDFPIGVRATFFLGGGREPIA